MFEWFDNLEQRDRRIVVIGSAIALLLIVWLIIGPLYGNLDRVEKLVDRQAMDLVTMQDIAERSGPVNNTPDSPDSMVLIMRNAAQARNLQVDNYQPTGNSSVNTSLEGVSFDAMIDWLGELDNRYGIRVQNASIRSGRESGTVNSTLVLVRN